MLNNAFEYDDCFKCLQKFEDAYYCSTADTEYPFAEGMTDEFYNSLNEGWCCGEYEEYVSGWWNKYSDGRRVL